MDEQSEPVAKTTVAAPSTGIPKAADSSIFKKLTVDQSKTMLFKAFTSLTLPQISKLPLLYANCKRQKLLIADEHRYRQKFKKMFEEKLRKKNFSTSILKMRNLLNEESFKDFYLFRLLAIQSVSLNPCLTPTFIEQFDFIKGKDSRFTFNDFTRPFPSEEYREWTLSQIDIDQSVINEWKAYAAAKNKKVWETGTMNTIKSNHVPQDARKFCKLNDNTTMENDVYKCLYGDKKKQMPYIAVQSNEIGNEQVTIFHARTLLPTAWLCDEVIAAYCNALSKTKTNTKCCFIPRFVLEQDVFRMLGTEKCLLKLKKMCTRAIRQESFQSGTETIPLIILPYNSGCHWNLIVLKAELKTVLGCQEPKPVIVLTQYDSLGSKKFLSDDFLKNLYKNLYLILLQSAKIDAFSKETSVSIQERSFSGPMQGNSNDCGVFLCMYAAYHSGKFENKDGCTQSVQIDQTFITTRNCRASICASILAGRYVSPLYSEDNPLVGHKMIRSDEDPKQISNDNDQYNDSNGNVSDHGQEVDRNQSASNTSCTLPVKEAQKPVGNDFNQDDDSDGNFSNHFPEVDMTQSVSNSVCTLLARSDEDKKQDDKNDLPNDGSNDNVSKNDQGEEIDDDGPVIDINSKMIDNEDATNNPHEYSDQPNRAPCFNISNSDLDEIVLECNHSNSDKFPEGGESTLVSVEPFHIDISGKRAFYKAMNVNPPLHLYQKHCSVDKAPWTVKMGDIVAIQVPLEKGVQIKSSLYTVHCGFAEVITIFEETSLMQNPARDRTEKGNIPGNPSEKDAMFQLEVRWLWTSQDVFNSKKRVPKKDKFEHYDILYEGDSVDICDAESLLGPTMVHHSHFEKAMKFNDAGIPIAQIYIAQGKLVQLKQKHLLTIGTSDKRFERGMMYSQFLKVDSAIRTSFDKQLKKKSKALINVTSRSDWKAQFMSAMSMFDFGEGEVVGREDEKLHIKRFLYDAITNTNVGDSNSNSNQMAMLIGGTPGGGKTSTVSMVMKQLDQDKSDGKLPDFQYAYINAMNIRQIGDIYVEMWRLLNLNKQILTSGKALAYLRMCLSDAPSDVLQRAEIVPHLKNCHGTRTPFVLVFDEIDNVCTNNNRIMYNLFDWPSVGSQNGSTAQLILIGISNIVNLKDRLPNNIQSRLSAPSLYFPSYNASDFISIITNKIEVANNGNSILSADSISFASRKVASNSGDIRSVFKMCITAVENVYHELIQKESNGTFPPKQGSAVDAVIGIIKVEDMHKASKSLFDSTLELAVAHGTKWEVLMIVALAALQRDFPNRSKGFDRDEILTKILGMANALGIKDYFPCPQVHMLTGMFCRMGEAGLLELRTREHTVYSFDTLVLLTLKDYEVRRALENTFHCKLVEKFL